jgi:hypothetical protein
MKTSVLKITLLLTMLSLSILACGYTAEQQAATATQKAIDIGLTQTALAPTATSTNTPQPTPTATPIPLDIRIQFEPLQIEATKSDNQWFWLYRYTISNPNDYPITIAAFGDDTTGCIDNVNNCDEGSIEFNIWFVNCSVVSEVIPAGGTTCADPYSYVSIDTPTEDMVIRNVVWYRDPAGNLYKVIGDPITLYKPSDPVATVNISTAYMREGPGTEYYSNTSYTLGTQLTITGQALNCSWLQLTDSDFNTGWIYAPNLLYSLACADISAAYYPDPPATQIPATAAPSCSLDGVLSIQNDTGGTVTLYLSGPASFTFYLGTGATDVNICTGDYSYTAYGCGGATDSGAMSTGESHTFSCQ